MAAKSMIVMGCSINIHRDWRACPKLQTKSRNRYSAEKIAVLKISMTDQRRRSTLLRPWLEPQHEAHDRHYDRGKDHEGNDMSRATNAWVLEQIVQSLPQMLRPLLHRRQQRVQRTRQECHKLVREADQHGQVKRRNQLMISLGDTHLEVLLEHSASRQHLVI